MSAGADAVPLPWSTRAWWLGVALAGGLAAAAMAAAQTHWAGQWGLSALTLAIVLGIVAGNTFFPAIATHTAAGVDFSKNRLLRVGIVLYGFRITFQQIAAVGWAAMVIDVAIVTLTFVLAVQLGTRVFKLDRQTSMLIGAGSAICGAAAVMAAEPVVRAQAHKVSVAVATVVVFGTLAMFAYPLLYPYLHLSEQAYGVYAGSTIHEVAQVVAAGRSVSESAAATAVIVKMLRVMMLAPFLLVLSRADRAEGQGAVARITIPWFALLFIAAAGINSMQWLPPQWVARLVQLDTVLLAMAMAALGLRTHVGAIRQAGLRPLLLAAVLFGFLVIGGYGVNRAVTHGLG
ncbi:YeiH family protein [Tepidimonas sp. HKU77]|uniref:YeiH family protein n=1 Tax=Tepidimonas sp. HKU77 TaxID=3414503 RepID=UPI003C7E6095